MKIYKRTNLLKNSTGGLKRTLCIPTIFFKKIQILKLLISRFSSSLKFGTWNVPILRENSMTPAKSEYTLQRTWELMREKRGQRFHTLVQRWGNSKLTLFATAAKNPRLTRIFTTKNLTAFLFELGLERLRRHVGLHNI